jgi:heme-degrading monooxygenase HmoA
MCGVPCPLAWAYFSGGGDVLPCGRVVGGDGPPGMFKSTLAMEHGRWVLQAGGVVVLVDTEEKTSDTLTRSLLYDLEPDVRKRFRYAKAKTTDEAQQLINFFKEKAKDFRKNLKPEQQFPMLVIWDSLTGAVTEGQLTKLEKEGSAATRAFPEQALQISNFYKSYTVDDAFFTLLHVQHAKKNNDPNAVGDDEFVPNGGLEPKYKSTYHFRMTSVRDIESQDWAGKQVSMKMIKSGIGENHRRMPIRVLWRHRWVEVPVTESKGDGKWKIVADPTGKKITPDEALVLYDGAKQALEPEQCEALLNFLGLLAKNPPSSCPAPQLERRKLQQTWFDWGWALGNLLVELKYGEGLYAAEKKELSATLDFTQVSKDVVKSKEVFGDAEEHSLSEFGTKIESMPEIVEKLKGFLGITKYQTVEDYAATHTAQVSSRKKKDKE